MEDERSDFPLGAVVDYSIGLCGLSLATVELSLAQLQPRERCLIRCAYESNPENQIDSLSTH